MEILKTHEMLLSVLLVMTVMLLLPFNRFFLRISAEVYSFVLYYHDNLKINFTECYMEFH